MKLKLLAAVGAALVFAAQGAYVFADYGYDDGTYGYSTDYNNYDTDYTYGNTTDTTDYSYDDGSSQSYTDESSADSSADSSAEGTSSVDPEKDHPVTVTLEPSTIKDKKFVAKLKIKSSTPVASVDFTISYDTDVLKLLKTTVNESAGGTAAAAETEDGVIQYQYVNAEGSEWEESYLTLSFEITEISERSTVLYIVVNSLTDASATELTYRADGTIIQIEGAVPVDASTDESMYTELKVARSDKTIGFDSLGLKDVKSVTFEDGELASADAYGISTLAVGLTNMTVEFNDGTFGYYRLVIAEPSAVTELNTDSSNDSAALATIDQTAVDDTAIMKTETSSPQRMKYFIIYVVVLLGIAALFVEYFVLFGNPYAQTLAILRERKQYGGEAQGFEDDDMFPEQTGSDEYDGGEQYGDYDGYEYADEYDDADEYGEQSAEFDEAEYAPEHSSSETGSAEGTEEPIVEQSEQQETEVTDE